MKTIECGLRSITVILSVSGQKLQKKCLISTCVTWVQAAVPTAAIPTTAIPTNASEKAELTLTLILTVTLTLTHCITHIRNVGIVVVGIAAVGIAAAS